MFESSPEPTRPPATLEEKRRHRFSLAFSLNVFVLLYHILHKLIMPVGIALISGKSIHFLDWWWIYHLILVFMMRRKKWDDAWMWGAIFFGWGGVVLQVVSSFMEYDWHRVSLWVTAGGTMGVLFFLSTLMKRTSPTRHFYAAIIVGFSLGLTVQWMLYGFSVKLPQEMVVRSSSEMATKTYAILEDINHCGTLGFSLMLQDSSVKLPPLASANQIKQITIHPCGFSQALGYWKDDEDLFIENKSENYLNVKLFYLDKEHWKPFKNVPLRLGDHVAISPHAFEGYSVILVVSDSHPQKGILVLLNPHQTPFQEEIAAHKNGLLEIDRQHMMVINAR